VATDEAGGFGGFVELEGVSRKGMGLVGECLQGKVG
jgi:hypothetical protein